jgi:inosine/xanthosine triphosphatase
MGKSCVLGGTFTCVHAGHDEMLHRCKGFSRITIGLTSDAFVKRHKIYPSFPYGKRLAGLKAALARHKLLSRTEILKIEDEAGGAQKLRGVDAMVASEETLPAAGRINLLRRRNRLAPLKIISVPLVYGEDLKKISCQSIYEGKTDMRGRLLKPLAIQAGTDNPAKLRGTAYALRRIFGKKFLLRGHTEHTGVPAHPFNQETFFGARNRAHHAFARSSGKCDYSIGMESGLFELKKGLFIDITVCCVYDGNGETYGTGMGFAVPTEIARRIRRENSDLSAVLKEIAGIDGIGKKNGAIGYFSAGILKRREQIEQSVACAFVPRIARAKKGTKY